MTNDCMLTTFDNPFDPFEQLTSWRLFDIEKGYFTCERLAKLVEINDEMSQIEMEEAYERAMDEMIRIYTPYIYKKVTRNSIES